MKLDMGVNDSLIDKNIVPHKDIWIKFQGHLNPFLACHNSNPSNSEAECSNISLVQHLQETWVFFDSDLKLASIPIIFIGIFSSYSFDGLLATVFLGF